MCDKKKEKMQKYCNYSFDLHTSNSALTKKMHQYQKNA